MKNHIEQSINEAIQTQNQLISLKEDIEKISLIVVNSLKQGGKIVFCGNGGSAADSQHLAAEFISLLDSKNPRASLPALALTTNTSVKTAIANDMGFEHIFSRQVEGLVSDKDVIIGISTSGNSPNVINALKTAKEKGAKVIGFTGAIGGKMSELGLDAILKAPSENCNRIQEIHITAGHIMCGAVEKEFFN